MRAAWWSVVAWCGVGVSGCCGGGDPNAGAYGGGIEAHTPVESMVDAGHDTTGWVFPWREAGWERQRLTILGSQGMEADYKAGDLAATLRLTPIPAQDAGVNLEARLRRILEGPAWPGRRDDVVEGLAVPQGPSGLKASAAQAGAVRTVALFESQGYELRVRVTAPAGQEALGEEKMRALLRAVCTPTRREALKPGPRG
jgi:hypothetical protein